MRQVVIFRGKDKKTGEWCEGELVMCTTTHTKTPTQTPVLCQHGNYGGIIYITSRHFIDPETLGMWTGLNDYSGKKIFDGDVIKHCYTKEVYLVRWNPRTAAFKLYHRPTMRYYDFGGSNDERFLDIIDNVYDNLEWTK